MHESASRLQGVWIHEEYFAHISWPQTSGLPLKGSQYAWAPDAKAMSRRMIYRVERRTRDEDEHYRNAQHRARPRREKLHVSRCTCVVHEWGVMTA